MSEEDRYNAARWFVIALHVLVLGCETSRIIFDVQFADLTVQLRNTIFDQTCIPAVVNGVHSVGNRLDGTTTFAPNSQRMVPRYPCQARGEQLGMW
jgi:hypothetical protein